MERKALSQREATRAGVVERVVRKELTVREAADILLMSLRHTKRLVKRFRDRGAHGLLHGNCGRKSNHSYPSEVRDRVLDLIRERYSGVAETGPGQRFGPTLVSEHLLEDEGLAIPVSTLTDWMRSEGLWSRRRKRKRHLRRRARKEHFGELVQLDGSFHDWLEGRGPRGCLMTMTDDATGTVLMRLASQETFWDAVAVLRAWIRKYGVPRAIYTDLKNVYHSPREGRPAEATQFGRVCAKLGIRLIAAKSPQAKGRVERTHGTSQDRLVKELRLRNISTHAGVNEYLENHYLDAHNRRFARKPASAADYHMPMLRSLDSDDTWCIEEKRRVSLDGVISYKSQLMALKLRRDMPSKATVLVRSSESGTVRVIYRDREEREHRLEWTIYQPAQKQAPCKPRRGPWVEAMRPKANHPWRLRNAMEVAEAMAAKRNEALIPHRG